jgi:hypothetical protein
MNKDNPIKNKSILEMTNLGIYDWIYLKGMLFGSLEKWWGSGGERKAPHEGVDLCMYRDIDGRICNIDETFKVSVCFNGRVYRIIDDFLGKTIFIGHEVFYNSMQLFSVYGHCIPIIIEGRDINDGKIIVTVSESKNIEIKTHLHITTAWLPMNISIDRLNWKTINNPQIAKLIDPLEPIIC